MKFLRSQPTAVWAVAAAAVVSFMGLGLVDPILPAIAHDLRASPSDVELLFTSYFAFTGLSMLFSSVVASRIGTKRTLLAGLALIVVFSHWRGYRTASARSSGCAPAGDLATRSSSRRRCR